MDGIFLPTLHTFAMNNIFTCLLYTSDLLPGTKRFGELKKSVGNVSQKVLTAQLRQMEDSGLLTRTVYPERCV